MSSGDQAPTVVELVWSGAEAEEVKRLSRASQDLLGQLSWAAFEEAAAGGRLIGAWIGSSLAGYCLFYRRKRDNAVILTHVCVSTDFRGRGVAQALVEHVAASHPFGSAMALSCRSDYDAAHIWPKLGFARTGSKPGRRSSGSVLERWVRPLNDNNLFSYQPDDRRLAVVDTDVLRDLAEPRSDFPSSIALEDDWVVEAVDLVTVPNVETEISRAADELPTLSGACGRFQQLSPPASATDMHRSELAAASIPTSVGVGDRLNLAQASAGSADYFVTRDGALLANAGEIGKAVGVDVLSPSDLLLRLHADNNFTPYRPDALSNTAVQVGAAQTLPNVEALTTLVDADAAERARALRPVLERCVADIDSGGRIVVARDSADRVIAILALRTVGRSIVVEAIRVATDRDRYSIARQMVHLARTEALSSQLESVHFEGHIPVYASRALRDEGFDEKPDSWSAECDERLCTAEDGWPSPESSTKVGDLSASAVSQIERQRWPLKLVGGNVPTYIVPIKPEFAHALFDHDPPHQTILQRDKHLGLAREHVYYKSVARFIKAPARILWYVSGTGPNTGLRAWSWLDAVDTDRPGSLFQRHGRNGVFERSDIEAASGKGLTATALRFSRTELFTRHLTLKRSQQLIPALNTSGYLTTARAVDEHVFHVVYVEGMELDDHR